jgi:hypothetical protein
MSSSEKTIFVDVDMIFDKIDETLQGARVEKREAKRKCWRSAYNVVPNSHLGCENVAK